MKVMDIEEQDPEVTYFNLHSEATQDDMSSSDSPIKPLPHGQSLVGKEHLPNHRLDGNKLPTVGHTQVSELTKPSHITGCFPQFSGTSLSTWEDVPSAKARTRSCKVKNGTRDLLNSVANAPLLGRPKQGKETSSTMSIKLEHATTTQQSANQNKKSLNQVETSRERRPSSTHEHKKAQASVLKGKRPIFIQKSLSEEPIFIQKSLSEESDKKTSSEEAEKTAEWPSPKVPLAFAIMAGEVSVEFPDPDENANVKAVLTDSESDSDSDSDSD